MTNQKGGYIKSRISRRIDIENLQYQQQHQTAIYMTRHTLLPFSVARGIMDTFDKWQMQANLDEIVEVAKVVLCQFEPNLVAI